MTSIHTQLLLNVCTFLKVRSLGVNEQELAQLDNRLKFDAPSNEYLIQSIIHFQQKISIRTNFLIFLIIFNIFTNYFFLYRASPSDSKPKLTDGISQLHRVYQHHKHFLFIYSFIHLFIHSLIHSLISIEIIFFW